MNLEDKADAEKVLRHICVGRYVMGFHWNVGTPILLIDNIHHNSKSEAYLTIESYWQMQSTSSTAINFPDTHEIPILKFRSNTMAHLAAALCDLRNVSIIDVWLTEKIPHLILLFENGQRLIINGHHEYYECWDALLTNASFQVVAVPGDNVAVWGSE